MKIVQLYCFCVQDTLSIVNDGGGGIGGWIVCNLIIVDTE